MIVQCPDCTTRYQLDPQRVPPERIRVRCPSCRYVFPVDGSLASSTAVTETGVSASVPPVASTPVEPTPVEPTPVEPTPVEPTPVPEPSAEVAAMVEEKAAPQESQSDSLVEDAPAAADEGSPDAGDEAPGSFDLEIEHHSHQAAKPVHDSAVETVESEPEAAVATADAPEPAADMDPQDKKARRLARALVSDILAYNRDSRDKALAEGNLVQALGHEIKKSWELYKERVTPEVANSTNHFREALNDILANGQKIF